MKTITGLTDINTTTWLFPGTTAEALSDFMAKRKEVVSCRIVKGEA